MRLGAMCGWYTVIPMRGFIFFGSATTLYAKIKASLAAELDKPRAARLRYVMIDATYLTGVDPTAINTIGKASGDTG